METENINQHQIDFKPSSSHVQNNSSNNLNKLILALIIISLVLSGIFLWIYNSLYNYKDKNQPISETRKASITPTIPVQLQGEFDVVIKDNANNKRKSDIYLKNKKTNKELFFITYNDVYKNHYHNAEFHNGNLYLILRPGGEDIYETNPKWTDELVRINLNKEIKKLFFVQGLDFRVSSDEKRIVIIGQDKLTFMDFEGNQKKFISSSLLTVGENIGYGFLAWGDHDIWLDNAFGPTLHGIVKVDTNSYKITQYDLSGHNTGTEYSMNPQIQKLAFTNYPAIFDAEGQEIFQTSKKKITLTIYDIKNKTTQEVATSITKRFNPVWISDTTLEYDDPNSENRITKQIF